NDHRAVLFLEVFEYGEECSPDCEPRAVECVDEAGLSSTRGPVSYGSSPRLEVGEVAAGENFPVCIFARHPYLYVVCLRRGKAHVARAEEHNPVGDAQKLEHA